MPSLLGGTDSSGVIQEHWPSRADYLLTPSPTRLSVPAHPIWVGERERIDDVLLVIPQLQQSVGEFVRRERSVGCPSCGEARRGCYDGGVPTVCASDRDRHVRRTKYRPMRSGVIPTWTGPPNYTEAG